MKGKIVLCRCEDVTLHDVEHAVARGYADLEEVKRYTGFGTGPCQGKECLGPIACTLARLTGAPPATIAPFTARPPLQPTPLGLFAADPAAHVFIDERSEATGGGDPAGFGGGAGGGATRGIDERARPGAAPEGES